MLYLHHGNAIKVLKDHLIGLLKNSPLSVLQAEQILVQNPGVKRWLQQQIAEHSGIAANIEFPLPSRFVWDIFLSQFEGIQQLSTYDAEVLRWSLLAILRQNVDDPHLELLKDYQLQDQSGLASFQLASRLAGLFDHYLVYRPKMIKQWDNKSQAQDNDEQWQAYLWRLLREQNPEAHRSELIMRLIQTIKRDALNTSGLPERLFVFALSSMSPLYVNVMAALAEVIDIHFYVINPCRHYWGDILSQREQLKRGEKPIIENELLASLGTQGRDFIDGFYNIGCPYQDHHHFTDIKPDSLLNLLKHDILNFSQSKYPSNISTDDSIKLVSCYSELRELQVLQDYLLDLLQHDEQLQPHEIVVMCPDINQVSPYIDAVFAHPSRERRIPYSISDHNILSATPLLQAFLEWLDLPGCRFTASDISGWLELPALQRAYQLDQQALDAIRYWIQDSHIRWGLDANHRNRLGFAADDLNTWAHGIRQIMTAYLMPTDFTDDGMQTASAVIINQQEFVALGQLQKLLDDLERWQRQLSQPRSMNEWQRLINQLLAELLELDDEEEWQLKPVRDEVNAWQQQSSLAGYDQKLSIEIIRHLLQQTLEQAPANHYYLTGGINFCNLIPMRTLPFKVVCLIGMGEQQFPRGEYSLQMNLMVRKPEKGDPSKREDDRYMFLQSIISAQQKLYISYVGRNKQDDTELQPSVVINELQDYVEQTQGKRIPVKHSALQPFSAKNFIEGSYASQWHVAEQNHQQQAFNKSIGDAFTIEQIELSTLIQFFRNPHRYFLQQRLGMQLIEPQAEIEDEESFSLQPLPRHALRQALFNEFLEKGVITESRYMNSGMLSPQNSGRLEIAEQKSIVAEQYQELIQHPEFNNATEINIQVQLQNIQIIGRVSSYSAKGLLQCSQSKMQGRGLLVYWLQHCLLCATETISFSQIIFLDKVVKFEILSSPAAINQLEDFILLYLQGQQRALSFYPDTAFIFQKTLQQKGIEAALKKIEASWQEDGLFKAYEATDRYIKTALKNESPFSEEFRNLSQSVFQPLIDNVIEGL